jgi:hypothetical protein
MISDGAHERKNFKLYSTRYNKNRALKLIRFFSRIFR